jgi:hypothetical protein
VDAGHQRPALLPPVHITCCSPTLPWSRSPPPSLARLTARHERKRDGDGNDHGTG